MLETIQKTRAYLAYIEEHYDSVQTAWNHLQKVCKDMEFVTDPVVYRILDSRVKLHDLSKLSVEEFVPYRRKFFPTEWEEGEKISPKVFNAAWEHHKEHNRHHWQTWTKIDSNDSYEWKMGCVHMILDWMAMSYKFGGTAQKYYEDNKRKIKLPDYAVKFMYEIFERIEQR